MHPQSQCNVESFNQILSRTVEEEMQSKPRGASAVKANTPVRCVLIHTGGRRCVCVCWSVVWGCVIRYASCPN